MVSTGHKRMGHAYQTDRQAIPWSGTPCSVRESVLPLIVQLGELKLHLETCVQQ